MKILVSKPNGGAIHYISKGFINAFKSIGCDAKFWEGDTKTWIETNPDILIISSGHRRVIPEKYRGNTKIAIHVNPYGTKLNPINGSDINEPKEAIDWTLSQRPTAVFGYGYKDDANTYWSSWLKLHNIPFVGVPTAADHVLYYPSDIKTRKIVYFGGRWPYKAHNIDKWLLPVINLINIDIMGWGGWQGIKGYIGPLSESDSGRNFIASGEIGPCICEPHTSRYGIDIPERFFKLALCKTLPIIDYIPNFDRYYNNGTYLMARDPSEYCNLIVNYANNSDFKNKKNELVEEIYKQTKLNHTYLNRMRDLCVGMNIPELVEKFDNKIKEINS